MQLYNGLTERAMPSSSDSLCSYDSVWDYFTLRQCSHIQDILGGEGHLVD